MIDLEMLRKISEGRIGLCNNSLSLEKDEYAKLSFLTSVHQPPLAHLDAEMNAFLTPEGHELLERNHHA